MPGTDLVGKTATTCEEGAFKLLVLYAGDFEFTWVNRGGQRNYYYEVPPWETYPGRVVLRHAEWGCEECARMRNAFLLLRFNT